MSKRTFYQTYIDEYYPDYHDLARYFRMDVSSSSSSSSAAASSLSSIVSSKAQYNLPLRFAVPKLANDYACVKQVLQFNNGPAPVLQVPQSNVDMNQTWAWTPSTDATNTGTSFTAAPFVNSGPLPQALFAAYNEYRVRAVRVTLNPQNEKAYGAAENNAAKIYAYRWDPESHNGLNVGAEIGSTFTKLIECGEKYRRVSSHVSDVISMVYVPQVLSSIYAAGGANTVDIPHPWLETNSSNLAQPLYGPYIIWRQMFGSLLGPITNDYQIIVSMTIEFRNAKAAQM